MSRARLVEVPGWAAPPGGHVFALKAGDGVGLRAAAWAPGGPPRARVLIFTGRTEFIEKYFEAIAALTEAGCAVATLDWRGQGLSDRLTANPNMGYVRDFEDYLCDLDALAAATGFDRPGPPVVGIGHSMGGAIATLAALERPGLMAGLVATAPMFGVNTGVTPGWVARGLLSALRLQGDDERYIPGVGDANIYMTRFEENFLTHDAERYALARRLMRAEPRFSLGGPTLGWLAAAFRVLDGFAARGRLEAMRAPARVVLAGEERVVSNAAARAAAARMGDADIVEIDSARHELFHERAGLREALFQAILGHIERVIEAGDAGLSPRGAAAPGR